MIKACEHCGASFKATNQQLSRGQGRFCSRKCKGAALQLGKPGHMRGRPSPKKLPDTHRQCRFCGKDFVPSRSQICAGTGVFCSRACSSSGKIGETFLGFFEGRNLRLHPLGRRVVIDMGDGKGQRLYHRLLLERLGVDLTGKIVHHIDGNPLNNSLENLQILSSTREHHAIHKEMRRKLREQTR